MAQQQKFGSPYADNFTHSKVLDLQGDEENKRASFKVIMTGNKVRLTIWTNIDGDAENGKIGVVLPNAGIWYTMMTMIKEVAQADFPKGDRKIIRLSRYGQGGYKAGAIPDGDVFVGKDKEGIVYLSFIRPNRPKLKFPILTNSALFQMIGTDGNEVSKEENSRWSALGYAAMGEQIAAAVLVKEYVKPAEKQGGGFGGNRQGGGNNYQNNNNGGGNSYGNRSTPDTGSDDDLTF